MPDKPDIWYSAKVVQYVIQYDTWIVMRYTPKGVWLRRSTDRPSYRGQLLLGSTINAFAAPTKYLALQDALARSRKNEKMLVIRHADAMADTAYLQELMKKEECGNAFDF